MKYTVIEKAYPKIISTTTGRFLKGNDIRKATPMKKITIPSFANQNWPISNSSLSSFSSLLSGVIGSLIMTSEESMSDRVFTSSSLSDI